MGGPAVNGSPLEPIAWREVQAEAALGGEGANVRVAVGQNTRAADTEVVLGALVGRKVEAAGSGDPGEDGLEGRRWREARLRVVTAVADGDDHPPAAVDVQVASACGDIAETLVGRQGACVPR